MAQTKPIKRPDILNDPNVIQEEIKRSTYNGDIDWDAVLDTKKRLDKYDNIKGKLEPKSSGDEYALRVRQKDAARDSLSLGDTEFDMDILPKFLSPIGRLGHNAKKYSIEFEDKPTNIRGYYDYTNEYRNEGLIPSINIRDTRDLDSAKIPPTYRKFYTSNPENPTFEHEAIHRGLNILYNYYRDDVPSFTKKYGKDTWEFLKKANSFQSHLKKYSEGVVGTGNPYVEVISEINDSNRAIKDGKYPELIDSFRNRFKSYLDKNTIEKILSEGYKIMPILEKAAMDRLTDENPTGGITDDAQNMPEKSKRRNFSGGGNVFKIGYDKAKPSVLAYYDNIKDELIFIDGGRVVKKPNRDTLEIGLRLGAYKLIKGHAKGGDTKMKKQMEMILIGGSNERDPVSGNEVPVGSLPEEVRDDVPALLSEGEYVVPADVVRFFGVKFFEDLRMQAKMGLSRMDATGRIGGEPVDGEPVEAAGGLTVSSKQTIMIEPVIELLARAIMQDNPSMTKPEAIEFATMYVGDAMKNIPNLRKGGIIKASNGLDVQTPEQIADSIVKETANQTATLKAPSSSAIQQFASSATTPTQTGMGRTKLYINEGGGTLQILVDANGVPLYGGAPDGYFSIDSEKGKELAIKYGFSGEVAATDDVTDTEEETPLSKPKKKDRSGLDAFERAEKTKVAAEKAATTAVERFNKAGVGTNLTAYNNLSFAQRLSLAPYEAKIMLGQSLTQDNIDTINNTLSNPAPEANIGDVLSNPLLLFTGGGKRDFIPSSTGRAPKGEDTGVSARSLGKGKIDDRNTLLKKANEKGKTVLDDIESKDGKDSKRYKDAKDALETVKNAIEQKPTLGFKKGALVKKPKRKPKAKRKSLGQRI